MFRCKHIFNIIVCQHVEFTVSRTFYINSSHPMFLLLLLFLNNNNFLQHNIYIYIHLKTIIIFHDRAHHYDNDARAAKRTVFYLCILCYIRVFYYKSPIM